MPVSLTLYGCVSLNTSTPRPTLSLITAQTFTHYSSCECVCFKVWHSKTFNGNDLDKLYHVDIIAELVSIFSPRLVWAEQLDAQGNLHTECRMFGSLALVEKYSTLLNKLRMMKVC